jgi:hypothetical protein
MSILHDILFYELESLLLSRMRVLANARIPLRCWLVVLQSECCKTRDLRWMQRWLNELRDEESDIDGRPGCPANRSLQYPLAADSIFVTRWSAAPAGAIRVLRDGSEIAGRNSITLFSYVYSILAQGIVGNPLGQI